MTKYHSYKTRLLKKGEFIKLKFSKVETTGEVLSCSYVQEKNKARLVYRNVGVHTTFLPVTDQYQVLE